MNVDRLHWMVNYIPKNISFYGINIIIITPLFINIIIIIIFLLVVVVVIL